MSFSTDADVKDQLQEQNKLISQLKDMIRQKDKSIQVKIDGLIDWSSSVKD